MSTDFYFDFHSEESHRLSKLDWKQWYDFLWYDFLKSPGSQSKKNKHYDARWIEDVWHLSKDENFHIYEKMCACSSLKVTPELIDIICGFWDLLRANASEMRETSSVRETLQENVGKYIEMRVD